MQPSIFNVQVPVGDGREVFLMNTLTDAQLLVSPDVPQLLERAGQGQSAFTSEERETLETLTSNGFLVPDRTAEERSLDEYFHNLQHDNDQLRVTVMTTLQCNFACDYCFQGDHGDYNKHAEKMSLDTARELVAWVEQRLDEVRPERFFLTLFGGEPLLNLPVCYFLAEQCHALCEARGVRQLVSIITNGVLLTPEVVSRLTPYGLFGVKVTIDGDRDTHNRMRPLRGRQGTFDKILENVRRVADMVEVTIGGNFDESSVDSYPAFLDYLREQDFADKIVKINFKPIINTKPAAPKGLIPLTAVSATGQTLGGTCMSGAGAGSNSAGSACDNCHFVDEKMAYLRDETRRRGFPTIDGVHMGPCEIHRQHAHTIGPKGDLYICPGFTATTDESTGHINGLSNGTRRAALERFQALTPRKSECGDCAFMPVCGGGCSVAAHSELGDRHAASCHKKSFEAGVVSLAQKAVASVAAEVVR
ncbi:MAG: radical SAM protein [Acidobacteria bacterium]|nr:radical SAM protein [Acidobacteriota bacterium]